MCTLKTHQPNNVTRGGLLGENLDVVPGVRDGEGTVLLDDIENGARDGEGLLGR